MELPGSQSWHSAKSVLEGETDFAIHYTVGIKQVPMRAFVRYEDI